MRVLRCGPLSKWRWCLSLPSDQDSVNNNLQCQASKSLQCHMTGYKYSGEHHTSDKGLNGQPMKEDIVRACEA